MFKEIRPLIPTDKKERTIRLSSDLVLSFTLKSNSAFTPLMINIPVIIILHDSYGSFEDRRIYNIYVYKHVINILSLLYMTHNR